MKNRLLKLAMVVVLMMAAMVPAVVSGDGSDPWVAGIQVANLDTQPATITIEFYNTSGTLVYVYNDPTPVAAGDSRTYYVPTILPDSGDVEHHPFIGEIEHFVDCILNDVESDVNVEDAVKTHEVCIAVDMSAEQDGQPVRLPLIAD